MGRPPGTVSGSPAEYLGGAGPLVSAAAATASALCGECPDGSKCPGGADLLPPDISIEPVPDVADEDRCAVVPTNCFDCDAFCVSPNFFLDCFRPTFCLFCLLWG